MIHLEAEKSSQESQTKVNEAFEALVQKKDLGFWQLPRRDENWSVSEKLGQSLKSKYERLIVLGMGGSALGGKALVECLSDCPDSVHFIYNSDPKTFWHFLNKDWNPQKDAWLFISKSGGTIEVLSMADVVLSEMKKRQVSPKDCIHVITEEKDSPLANWAKQEGIASTAHPMDVGGRFSALCPVGLVPAVFAGIDINELRRGAAWILENHQAVKDFSGLCLDRFSKGEVISVFWSYVDQLNSLSPWLEQLWAESLGKRADLAVSSPMLSYGTAYQHSVLQQYMEGRRDKFFVFFRSKELDNYGDSIQETHFQKWDWLKGKNLGQVFTAEAQATEKALQEKGLATASLHIEKVDAAVIGAWVLHFQLVIGTLGEAVGIDAFNQPGVEAGKLIAKQILQNK